MGITDHRIGQSQHISATRGRASRERPADHYVLKTYITGTVRAFHEEARTAIGV